MKVQKYLKGILSIIITVWISYVVIYAWVNEWLESQSWDTLTSAKWNKLVNVAESNSWKLVWVSNSNGTIIATTFSWTFIGDGSGLENIPAGPQWPQGIQWIQGVTGSTWPQGTTGAIWPQGPQWETWTWWWAFQTSWTNAYYNVVGGKVGIGTSIPAKHMEILGSNPLLRFHHNANDTGIIGIEFHHREVGDQYSIPPKTAILSTWGSLVMVDLIFLLF